jgi:hypothetical protein
MTQYSDAGVEALLREQPEVLDQLQRATEQALEQSAFTASVAHPRNRGDFGPEVVGKCY